MSNSHRSPEPGTPAPAGAPAAPAAAGRPRRSTALLAIALLAALISALLIVNTQGGEHKAAPKTSTPGVVSLNVAEAAAYAATSSGSIVIKNYMFAPAATTVAAGTTVTWINQDTVPHTVTTKSGPASFDSGQIASGASYSAVFKTAGTYSYYCIDHPQMVATITVTAGGTTPPPTSTASATAPHTSPSGTVSHTTAPSATATHTTPPPSGGQSSTEPGDGDSTPPPSATSTTAPATSSPSATSSATGAPSPTMSMPGGGSTSCASAQQSLLVLLQHLNTTHLGESPGQQVQDLMNLNQYVLTHTVLVENMLAPLLNTAVTNTGGLLGTLLQHINTTHLGESPGQQVVDLMNVDQYVLTHTMLIENMIAPSEGLLTGGC